MSNYHPSQFANFSSPSDPRKNHSFFPTNNTQQYQNNGPVQRQKQNELQSQRQFEMYNNRAFSPSTSQPTMNKTLPEYFFFYKNDCSACKHAISISKKYKIASSFRAVNVDSIDRKKCPHFLTHVPAILYGMRKWNDERPKMFIQGDQVFEFLEKIRPKNIESEQSVVCNNGQCQLTPNDAQHQKYSTSNSCKIADWNDEWNAGYSDSYSFLEGCEDGMCHNFQFLDDPSINSNVKLTEAPMRITPDDPIRTQNNNKIKNNNNPDTLFNLNVSGDNENKINDSLSYNSNFSTSNVNNQMTNDFSRQINIPTNGSSMPLDVPSYQSDVYSSSTNGMRPQVNHSGRPSNVPDLLQPIDTKKDFDAEKDVTNRLESLKASRELPL